MKKRNKKYNVIEKLRVSNEIMLRDYAVSFVVNDKSAAPIKLVDLQGGIVPVSRSIADAITDFRYKWSIYMVVGCFNTKNEQEIKIDHAPCSTPYFQSELVDYLNERHQGFIDGLKSKNVNINFAGWLAKASGRELDPEEIYRIFDKQEAWV